MSETKRSRPYRPTRANDPALLPKATQLAVEIMRRIASLLLTSGSIAESPICGIAWRELPHERLLRRRRTFGLTTLGSSVWNTLLIGAGWTLGENWERVSRLVSSISNTGFVVFGSQRSAWAYAGGATSVLARAVGG
jgi:hypothetical protein